MVVRKRRKKNKLRGQRTHGGGGTKNRRGAGSRGGVGRAGSHKHKYSKYYTEFGVKRTLNAKKKGSSVNLAFISEKLPLWTKQGKVEKNVVDGKKLGFDKVLGRGEITEKIEIVNAKVSAKAADKITEAGGKVPAEETEISEENEAEAKEE